MNRSKLESALRDLRSVVRLPREEQIADDELVRRYAEEREEAAFAALVRRYGPMVLRVCYRVLHRSHDAEDAFQATFLILAREVASLRQRGAVGSWIHEVAYNAALRVRQRLARQRHYEEKHVTPMNPDNPEEGILRDDVQAVLYEELHRLPEKYRVPLVLCNLLGRTQEEASLELGLDRSTMSKRIKRAYAELRTRLLVRGVSLSLILLASLLHEEGKAGSVSTDLLLRTVRAAVGSVSGTAAVSASVAALTAKGAGGLFGVLKWTHVLVVAALTFAGGGFWAALAWQTPPSENGEASAMLPPLPTPAPVPRIGNRIQPPLGDCIDLRGTVLDSDGTPVPGALVAACGLRSFRHGKRNVRDEVLARGQADAEGRFQLSVPRPDVAWSLRSAYVHLWVASPGRAPATLRLPWRPEAPPVEVRLPLSETIRGRLLGDDGKPAAHVSIVVSQIGPIQFEPIQGHQNAARLRPALWPAPTATDAEGRFELHGLNVAQGVGLCVSDARYALRRAVLDSARWSGREGVLRLDAARLLEGKVETEDGTALPAARLRVLVYDAARHPLGSALDARTDAAGAFHIPLPVGQSYRIEAIAPDGVPYVGVGRELLWPKDAKRQELDFRLPSGVLVRGTVRDADTGAPIPEVHVQFRPSDESKLPPEILTGSNYPVIGSVGGSFLVVVPKADGFLFLHEPTGDYVMEEWTGRLRGFSGPIHAHRVLTLDAASGPSVREVGAALHRGLRIEGRAMGPNGEPGGDGAWLCRGRTCPEKLTEGQPQRYWNGRFTLRGCVPGRVYPVLILDAKRRLGAKVELLADADGNPVEVRLQPCGTARVRFIDDRGRPVAGYQPYLYAMVPSDRAVDGEDGLEPTPAEMHELDEFDPTHYRREPRTDAEGFVSLPALIPGVRYRMSHYRDAAGTWREIETKPGQTLSLPDVVLNRR